MEDRAAGRDSELTCAGNQETIKQYYSVVKGDAWLVIAPASAAPRESSSSASGLDTKYWASTGQVISSPEMAILPES